MGGGEFVSIATRIHGPEEAIEIGHHLLAALERPPHIAEGPEGRSATTGTTVDDRRRQAAGHAHRTAVQ
jgi:GGDEF domain-containing protein